MYLKTVLDYFGSQAAIAEFLGISPTSGAVSQWGELIPEKQALKLDRKTEGKLKYDPKLYEKNKQN